MSSREDILQNIRRNTRVRYEKPDLSALEQGAITYADQVAQFCKVVAEVGGRVVTVNEEKMSMRWSVNCIRMPNVLLPI